MEIELKYRIPDKTLMDTILADEYLASVEEAGKREQLLMKAAYFDTEDHILSRNDIAFRIRAEGARVVASLKWDDSGDADFEGLHTRREINVPTDDAACFLNPDIGLFRESEVGKDVTELLNGKNLISILEMKFLRRTIRIDTGDAICEVAMDDGVIITDFGECPISEMEIELFSGERDALFEVGRRLSEKYGLEPEPESKYARGLRLARPNEAVIANGAR